MTYTYYLLHTPTGQLHARQEHFLDKREFLDSLNRYNRQSALYMKGIWLYFAELVDLA